MNRDTILIPKTSEHGGTSAMKKVAILANPYAGSGKSNILSLTAKLYECLLPQVEQIFTGPAEMGAEVCTGDKVTVLGDDSHKNRTDTMRTAAEMIDAGAEMFFIVSGDGTYNDVFEVLKLRDKVVPIFGVAAGRFNTIFPDRAHNPFVSLRGEFRPFRIADLTIKDVMGIETRINAEVKSYGFFWSAPSSTVLHTDETGFIEIDALDYLDHQIRKVETAAPVANPHTTFSVRTQAYGDLEIARGENIGRMVVAHLVPEFNQIVAGMHGCFLEAGGYDGIAYTWQNPAVGLMTPDPRWFPLEQHSAGFHEGDVVEIRNTNKTVLMVDSSAICPIEAGDLVEIRVIKKLAKKAVIGEGHRA